MERYFQLPEMQKEWDAFATTWGLVEFIQSYPTVFPEGDFETLTFFVKSRYHALREEAEEQGLIFPPEGEQSFLSAYLISYELTRKSLQRNPELLFDPAMKDICRYPAPIAVSMIYPEILENPSYTNNESASWLLKGKATDPTLDDHCAKEGCSEKNLQMVATLEKTVHRTPLTVRILACQNHYEEIWESVRNEAYLRDLLQKTFAKKGIEVTDLGEIIHSFSDEHQQRGKKTDPLIERFRIRQRVNDKGMLQFFKEQFQTSAIGPFFAAYNDSLVDIARKYRMEPETVAVAQALPSYTYDDAISLALQGHSCIWIEFTEPVQSPRGKIWGFSYCWERMENAVYAQRVAPMPKGKYQYFCDSFYPDQKLRKWGIDAFSADGDARWTNSMIAEIEEDEEKGFTWEMKQSLTMAWTGCVTGECGAGRPQCSKCRSIESWFFSFYVNCLRVLSGEFSDDETRDPNETKERFPQEKVKVSRKVPKENQPWKFEQKDIYHTFSIVSFDVLKKKKPGAHSTNNKRGSWMEKIPPEEYIHVRRRIGKGTHIIKDRQRFSRYLAEHGSTIPVRAHHRWVPIQLKHLNKIYLAKAETPILLEELSPSNSC